MEALAYEAPRVFITNYAGHDYGNTREYGEFVWITKGYVSFQSLDRVKYQVAEKVAESRKQDWLCLSGTPLISVLAVLIWYHKHKVVNLLVWDRKMQDKYRELIITEDNLTEILETL